MYVQCVPSYEYAMHCDGEKKIYFIFKMKPKYRGVKPVVVNMKLLIKFKDYLWLLICGRKSIYQSECVRLFFVYIL